MLGGQGGEMQPGDGQSISGQGVQLEERVRGIRDDGEIRPDLVVENVSAQNVDDFGQRPHLQRLGTQGGNRIDQQRQAGNVVQMGVGEHDMVDARHGFQRQCA